MAGSLAEDQKVANQSGTPVFVHHVTTNQTKTLLVNTEENIISLAARVRQTFGLPVDLAFTITLRGKKLGSKVLSRGLTAYETLTVRTNSLPGGTEIHLQKVQPKLLANQSMDASDIDQSAKIGRLKDVDILGGNKS